MIRADELRIGNLLLFNNLIQMPEYIKITPRFFCGLSGPSDDNKDMRINNYYRPIPLTEDWLIRFGFSKDGYRDGFIGIDVRCGMIVNWVLCEPTTQIPYYHFEFTHGKIPFDSKIKSVHQLQNLYFALTGQELTIQSKD